MKRIAVIEDGYVRDTQVFTADPAIIDEDPDWENRFSDIRYPCMYVGVFEGTCEGEIRRTAADVATVHPDIISLIPIE